MTRDLRSVLEDFSEQSGRVLTRTAPDPSTEVQHVASKVLRRRARSATVVATGALALALVGGLSTQWLLDPRPAPPALESSPTVSRAPSSTPDASLAPTPATSTPGPTPQPTASRTEPEQPPPAPVWPANVGEEEVMYGGEGPWWAVWVRVTAFKDLPPWDADPVAAELAAVGYSVADVPVGCVVPSLDALGIDPATDPWGLPVYFRSAQDAETFVGLWGRPVVGVVADADLSCDWG